MSFKESISSFLHNLANYIGGSRSLVLADNESAFVIGCNKCRVITSVDISPGSITRDVYIFGLKEVFIDPTGRTDIVEGVMEALDKYERTIDDPEVLQEVTKMRKAFLEAYGDN